MRLSGLACVLLALVVVTACGGGGDSSSPTEPPAPPVPLEGEWSGSVTITSPNPATCTMSLDLLRDGPDHLGNWSADCSGTQGSGIVFIVSLIGNQVLVSGLRSTTSVFGSCGWGATAVREGNRLRAEDWSTTQNCSTGPVLRGRFELTKR